MEVVALAGGEVTLVNRAKCVLCCFAVLGGELSQPKRTVVENVQLVPDVEGLPHCAFSVARLKGC
jgi:hypothetical protein